MNRQICRRQLCRLFHVLSSYPVPLRPGHPGGQHPVFSLQKSPVREYLVEYSIHEAFDHFGIQGCFGLGKALTGREIKIAGYIRLEILLFIKVISEYQVEYDRKPVGTRIIVADATCTGVILGNKTIDIVVRIIIVCLA